MGKIALRFIAEDCNGCHSCEVACKQEHGLGVGPRVVRVLEKAPLFYPLFCHHCDDPPCALACPEDAIRKDPRTGVVLHDSDKCTGCNAVPGESGPEKQRTSPCKGGCPAHIDVQGYVSLAAKGKFEEALKLIKEASPFPAICGRVCHHPCELQCNRAGIDEAVSIRSIERFIADCDLNSASRYIPEIKEHKPEKIAVVGSGPAGLSCAYYLAREGYRVTIFEKGALAGGMLSSGIPAYRLPRHIVEAEIKLIGDMGVTIKTGVEVGADVTIARLRQEGFKAFFIGVGTQECLRLGIPGEDLPGVYPGLEFLRRVNSNQAVVLGKSVAVIGGGNAALDAARTARRLGAENVIILYRRSEAEIPANEEEVIECRQEGIPVKSLTQPVRFVTENGQLAAIECLKTRLADPDQSGRPRPELIPGSEFTIPIDNAITALGQEADWSCLTPECACTLSDWGTMNVDPLTLQSDDADIFAGGDAVRGPQSVITAIADGRAAALSIGRFLQGIDLRIGHEPLAGITPGPQKTDYHQAARAEAVRLDPRLRAENFDEVQKTLAQDVVMQEAKRCINCGACCVQACPYQVMQFNHDITKAVKCDLCIEKRARDEAPACSLVCPAHCIIWGDPQVFPASL